MTDQQADIDGLKNLADTMGQLKSYCETLKDSSHGFAYMLPADWQGPAHTAFLASFVTWEAMAEELITAAGELEKFATAVHKAYDQGTNDLDSTWSEIQSSLG